MADIQQNFTTVARRPSPHRTTASDTIVPQQPSLARAGSTRSRGGSIAGRPPLFRAPTSQANDVPLLPTHRRRSDPNTPGPRNMGDYFLDAPVALGRGGRRRSSAAEITVNEVRSGFNPLQMWTNMLYPNDSEIVEPFSFVSTKTSPVSGLKLALGLIGQAGYTFGGILIVNSVFKTAPIPGLASGVGVAPPPMDPEGPDGHLHYKPPSAAVGAVVLGVGLVCGVASSLLFLADGLKIAGNRKKAFFYVSMHMLGIVLITASKFVITLGKDRVPLQSVIALSLPSGIGRGIHMVTIPRSFSQSEIVWGDVARLTFEQRQIASEVLRLAAAVFFTLWAASWSIQNYDPLEREAWGILASLTLNVSAALPNTNLRRADIFRRSQVSLLSPQLQSFQLRSPPVRSPPISVVSPPPAPIHRQLSQFTSPRSPGTPSSANEHLPMPSGAP